MMSTRNELLEARLRSVDPLDPEDVAWDERSEQLLIEILATAPGRSSASAQPRPTSARSIGRRRVIGLAALAVAVLALAGTSLFGGSDGERGGLAALDRVAKAAAAQPAPNLSLPYLYAKTEEADLDTSVAGGQAWSVYVSHIDEEWIAADGSGRIRRISAPTHWVGPSDRRAWEAAGKPVFLTQGFGAHTEEEAVPAGHFKDELPNGGGSFSAMPSNPGELADWLTRRVEDPKYGGGNFSLAVKTLDLIVEILQSPRVTPQQRAALYEAEALIPGVEYLGPATDLDGRRGVAVGARSANSGALTLHSLIFDPRTSQVLATQQTTLEPPKGLPNEPTPLVTASKLFFESGRTASLRSKPKESTGRD
jgi:hypothetical protein